MRWSAQAPLNRALSTLPDSFVTFFAAKADEGTMAHHPSRNELLAMAADCRFLARRTDDQNVRAQLLEIADAFDREASQIAARPPGGSASQHRDPH